MTMYVHQSPRMIVHRIGIEYVQSSGSHVRHHTAAETPPEHLPSRSVGQSVILANLLRPYHWETNKWVRRTSIVS